MNLKGFKVFKSKSNNNCFIFIISQVKKNRCSFCIHKQSQVLLAFLDTFSRSIPMGPSAQTNHGASLKNETPSSAMAGILWLKGCRCFRTKSEPDCLEQLKRTQRSMLWFLVRKSTFVRGYNVDYILRKMDLNIKILVL